MTAERPPSYNTVLYDEMPFIGECVIKFEYENFESSRKYKGVVKCNILSRTEDGNVKFYGQFSNIFDNVVYDTKKLKIQFGSNIRAAGGEVLLKFGSPMQYVYNDTSRKLCGGWENDFFEKGENDQTITLKGKIDKLMNWPDKVPDIDINLHSKMGVDGRCYVQFDTIEFEIFVGLFEEWKACVKRKNKLRKELAGN